MGGNADVVKLLLDKGADMGEPSTLTPTPYTLRV
jgi:ankyrin repeat protein